MSTELRIDPTRPVTLTQAAPDGGEPTNVVFKTPIGAIQWLLATFAANRRAHTVLVQAALRSPFLSPRVKSPQALFTVEGPVLPGHRHAGEFNVTKWDSLATLLRASLGDHGQSGYESEWTGTSLWRMLNRVMVELETEAMRVKSRATG